MLVQKTYFHTHPAIQMKVFDTWFKRSFPTPGPNEVFQRPVQTKFFDTQSQRSFSTPVQTKSLMPIQTKFFNAPPNYNSLHSIVQSPSRIAYHAVCSVVSIGSMPVHHNASMQSIHVERLPRQYFLCPLTVPQRAF